MKISLSKQSFFLVLGILIFSSYLFQIYWLPVEVNDNVVFIRDGFAQRLLFKIIGIFLLYFALIRSFSLKSFKYNYIIKIPLAYYIVKTIFLIPLFFWESYLFKEEYIMSANIIFLLLIPFVNFYGKDGDELFSKLVKIMTLIVCLQLIVELIIHFYNLNHVNTLIGGMGNANTFGLHLIIASLGLRFIYRRYFFSNIILIMSLFTGSLITGLISTFLILQSFINFVKFVILKKTAPLIFLLIIIFVILSLLIIFFIFNENFELTFSLSPQLSHIFKKAIEHYYVVYNLIIGEINWEDAGGLILRVSFFTDAWILLSENPMSIIFGHPDFLIFWKSDIFFLNFIVNHGLPMFLLFIISNVILVFRGMKNKTPLSKFALYTLIVYMLFFCVNRILDYWPSPFMYLLVFNYLSRKIKLSEKSKI